MGKEDWKEERMKLDIKALLITLVIMVLIVGYIISQAVTVEKPEVKVELTPWCGSYTPTAQVLPYFYKEDLEKVNG